MILTVQAILSLVVGWCVFLLWRRLGATNRVVCWLVTGGLLIRAVGGQVTFWVSYLHLPIARSLQIGDGLWIFAVDAVQYFGYANRAASGGLNAILYIDRTTPSVFFVQILALFVFMLGATTSVAILLNVTAYLGCCMAIVSFGDPNKSRTIIFAIAALSFSPSAIVWSLQPLKDTLFLFLVAMFFGAARLWQQAWNDQKSPRRIPTAVVTTLLMVAMLYGISGIRWYFGIVMVLASMPFVLMAMLRSQQRWPVLLNAVVLVVLLGAALFAGAGPYVPPAVRDAVFGRAGKKQFELPGTLLSSVTTARTSFERAGGATTIGAGGATRKIDATLGAEEQRIATVEEPPQKKGESTETVVPQPSPALPPVTTSAEPVRTSTHKLPGSSDAEPAPILIAPATSSVQPVPASPPTASSGVEPAQIAPQAAARSPEPPVASAPKPQKPVKVIPQRSRPPRRPAPVEHRGSTGVPLPATKIRQPSGRQQTAIVNAQPAEGGSASGMVRVPASPVARLVAGAAAVVLPLSIARRLGILDVRGGRGLWLFVEFDTIAFDIVLIFTLVALVRAVRRHTLRAPVFWMILLVTLAIGGSLAYAVSNFGTLFRHRNMVFLGLLLLPLAIEAQRSSGGRSGDPAGDFAEEAV